MNIADHTQQLHFRYVKGPHSERRMDDSRLGRKIATLGLVSGLLVFAIAAAIGKGLGISLTLFLSCAVYLIIERLESQGICENRYELDRRRFWWVAASTTLFLVIIFVYSVSMFLYQRPPGYFMLVCFFSGLIGMQICGLPKRTLRWSSLSVLLQIVLLSASLRWGVVFEFPTLIGSDNYHLLLANYILENGHIIPSTFVIDWAAEWFSASVSVYHTFPLMHIIVSAYSLVTSITSYKESLVFSVGFFEIVSLLFVFLIARRFFSDRRIPLLATLLLGVSVPHIYWGIWLIPQSFGIGLFTMLIYLIMRAEEQKSYSIFGLFLVVLFAIMLEHTVSAFILILVIFLLSMSRILATRLLPGTSWAHDRLGTYLILSSVALLAYWMLFSNFLTARVDSILRAFGNVQLLALSAAGKGYLAYEVDNLGAYLFYLLGIIGLLGLLKKRKLNPTRFGMSALALLFLVYGFWLMDFTSLLPDRWFVFASTLLAIPAAVGVVQLVGVLQRRHNAILVLVLICSFTFFTVMNSDVNMDAPLIGTRQVIRYSYLESEMVGARWATSHSTTVYADAGMTDLFMVYLRARINYIDFTNLTAPQRAVLIIRNYVYERPTGIGPYGPYIIIDRRSLEGLRALNRVYFDGEVTVWSSEEWGS